jgi:multidrug efflux pump subunit AcrB
MTKQTKDIITIVSILIFAILAVIFVPLATIWSLNTLFPILSIPYTFYSWLAVVVMNLTWMYKPNLKKD